MFQSSNALPIRSVNSSALESQLTAHSRNASLLFLGSAFVLCFFAFIEPLEYAWTRPTYDESQDDERSEVGARDGSLQRQITLGCLGLFGVAGLALSTERELRLRNTLGIICIAYIAWCAASLLWTDELRMTLRRQIALACEIVAAIAIATRASPRQFAWLVFSCTLAWLSFGIVAEVSQGALQPWLAGYRFKGIFHPNIMSVNCALLILSSLYLSGGVPNGKRILYAIAAVSFVFLILTGSRTAIAAVFISLLAVWMITASMRKKVLIVGLTGLALAFVAAAQALNAFDVTSDWVSMGRQDHDVDSLSSRIPLWQELLNVYVPQKPLQGYGYGAFWTPAHITAVERTQGWNAPYAHCTYIDLLLSIGVIGTGLFVAGMVVAFVRASWLELRHPNAGYGFAAMLIASVLADGTMETTFGATQFMSFFAICAVCLLLSYDPVSAQLVTATEAH
jgi:exopolysaccharide production protein ExoQ